MSAFFLSGRPCIVAATFVCLASGCAPFPSSEPGSAFIAQAQIMQPQHLQSAQFPSAMSAHIAEASQRFGLPERWIRAVMHTESAGNPCAVSSAGAMGLMQIMPATWNELRARYGLGRDPFDPRDNILAGAAYLSELHDRFGSPGFLAAYNAGPGRYGEHLRTGRPLPAETRSYVARLLHRLDTPAAPVLQTGCKLKDRAAADPAQGDWRGAPLFAKRGSHET